MGTYPSPLRSGFPPRTQAQLEAMEGYVTPGEAYFNTDTGLPVFWHASGAWRTIDEVSLPPEPIVFTDGQRGSPTDEIFFFGLAPGDFTLTAGEATLSGSATTEMRLQIKKWDDGSSDMVEEAALIIPAGQLTSTGNNVNLPISFTQGERYEIGSLGGNDGADIAFYLEGTFQG